MSWFKKLFTGVAVGGAATQGACTPPASGPPVDGWQIARDTVTADPAATAWQGWPEYAVVDAAVLDDAIRSASKMLGKKGEVPDNQRDAERIGQRAIQTYRVKLVDKPEARAAIEGKVRQAFDAPRPERVVVRGDQVRIDLGYAPGPLASSGRAAAWEIVESEVVERFEVKGTVIAAKLEKYTAAHPTAKWVSLLVRIPAYGGVYDDVLYSYNRPNDKIVVQWRKRADAAYLSEPIGGDFGPFVRGEKSLYSADLWRCTPSSETFDEATGCLRAEFW